MNITLLLIIQQVFSE